MKLINSLRRFSWSAGLVVFSLLTSQARAQQLQLLANAGHSAKVVALELSPSGSFLASADEQTLKIWEVGARRVLTQLNWTPDSAQVRALCWRGSQEVAVLLDGPRPRVACYTRAGQLRWTRQLNPKENKAVEASRLTYLPGRNTYALGVQTNSYNTYQLLLLNADTGQLTATSPTFDRCPNGVVEEKGGTLLCNFGAQVLRYDPATGQAAEFPLAGSNQIIALRPWGEGFVTADLAAGVINWYRAGGEPPAHTTRIGNLPLPPRQIAPSVTRLPIEPTSECGKPLLVLSDSTVLLRYDYHAILLAHTNGRAHYLADPYGEVVNLTELTYSAGRGLLAYSDGQQLGLLEDPAYNPAQGQPRLSNENRLPLGSRGRGGAQLAYNAARHELIALTDESGSEVYRFNLDRLTMAVHSNGRPPVFSPGSADWATFADQDYSTERRIRFFKDDFSAPTDSFTLAPSAGNGHFGGENELARSADGRRLAVRNRARTEVQVWDVPGKKLLYTASAKPNTPDEEPHHFYLDPSGEFLAQEWRTQRGGEITTTRISRVSTGKPVLEYSSARDDQDKCTFCPRGSRTRVSFLPLSARAITPKGLLDLNTSRIVQPLEVAGVVAFSPQEKYLVSYDKYKNRLVLREGAQFKEVKSIPLPGFDAAPVFLTDSLLAVGQQEGICFYQVPSLKPLATLLFEAPEVSPSSRAGSYGRYALVTEHPSTLLVTPDGYFTGSRDAFRLAHFRTPDGQLLDFGLLEQHYNRPDILLRRLGLAPAAQQTAFRQAYEHRVRLQGSKATKAPTFAPQLVELVQRNTLALAGHGRRMALALVPAANRGTAREVTIRLNGRPAYTARLDTVPDRRRLIFTLDPGLNYLSLLATDAEGRICASLLHVIDCQLTAAEIGSTTYFVGLGAARYAQPGHDLRYPTKDVTDLEAYYRHRLPADQFESLLLTDKDVTKAALAKVTAFLAPARPNDRVIMLWAGHGLLDPTRTLYLATHDLDFANPAARGISFDALESTLGRCASHNQLLLLDACHSGWGEAAPPPGKQPAAGAAKPGQPATAGALAGRGATDVATADAPNAENALRVMERQFALFSTESGATVIAAAAGSEVAFESGEYGNGLFTASLLEGLHSGRADRNGDQQITVSELKEYVEQRTLQRSQGRQRPTARYVNSQADFVLAARAQTDYGVLHEAARQNRVDDLVYFLEEEHLDPDLADPENRFTALHYAAREGSLRSLVYLLSLEKKPRLDARNNLGWLPLHLAAYNNHPNVVYWLLFKGADANALTSSRETPAQLAAKQGHTAVVQALQNYPAVISKFGPPAAATNALVAQNLPLFRQLVEAPGFDPDALVPYGHNSVLVNALSLRSYEAVELLLRQGRSSLKARYRDALPLLFLPVIHNDRRLYELLVAHGADPTEKFENFTPLELAAKLERSEFADLQKK